MVLPPKKRMKVENNENSVEQPTESEEAISFPALPNIPLPTVNQPKEKILNVDADNKPISKRFLPYWCKVDFGGAPHIGYELGKIVLQLNFERSSAHEVLLTSDFTKANIVERFHGIDSIWIQVEGQWSDSKNAIQFRTRREISKEDASQISVTTHNNNDTPPHKYIEMKHFTFDFNTLKLPPALFGKPGKLNSKNDRNSHVK